MFEDVNRNKEEKEALLDRIGNNKVEKINQFEQEGRLYTVYKVGSEVFAVRL